MCNNFYLKSLIYPQTQPSNSTNINIWILLGWSTLCAENTKKIKWGMGGL